MENGILDFTNYRYLINLKSIFELDNGILSLDLYNRKLLIYLSAFFSDSYFSENNKTFFKKLRIEKRYLNVYFYGFIFGFLLTVLSMMKHWEF